MLEKFSKRIAIEIYLMMLDAIAMELCKCGHVFQIICIYGRKCCCSWRRGCRSMTVTAIQCSSGRGGPGESRRGLNRAQRMGCTLTWLLSTLR